MTYLMSWQGRVLSHHRATGALVHRALGEPEDDAEPIQIEVPAHRLQVSFDHYMRDDPGLASCVIPQGPLRGWELRRADDGRCLSVGRDGRFLCSPQGREAIEVRDCANAWEWFLPLAEADFQALRGILRHDWIIRSTGELVRSAAIRLGEHWGLRLGSLWLDLRFQTPLDLTAWPHRLTVLRDGWRIEQICRFRPLVYYAAFSDPAIMGQFALSLRSLRAIGGYDGAVAVMTDYPAAAIATLTGEPEPASVCGAAREMAGGAGMVGDPGVAGGAGVVGAPGMPDDGASRAITDTALGSAWLTTQPGTGGAPALPRTDVIAPDPSASGAGHGVAAGAGHPGCAVLGREGSDRTAFMSARYTIADWPAAWDFQPILYVDTDIVFEAAVEPILRAIATSDRLAAPVETAAPLATTASVGAGLLQLDGFDPRDRLGFNSGTIGIPNLAAHATTFRLICRVLANHAGQRGRATLTHGDQEVANYVAARTGTFDTALLAGFVRVAGEEDLPEAERRAIAHFWASPTAIRRVEAMRRHMRRLGMQL